LVEKLDFSWDEVHDIAEQLEHIKSEKLINKLDDFLGNPTEDPHGDPIPNAKGQIITIEKQLLSELSENQIGICVGVKDSSSEFLKYLDKQEISLGSKIEVISKESFDLSLIIKVDSKEMTISNKIASNLFVKVG
jgi:DtxR family Mn-dependent transcriptional regulator